LISHLFEEQNCKGYEKYGRTIDHAPDSNYEWNAMISEELVDALQYATKEKNRLHNELKVFKDLLLMELNKLYNTSKASSDANLCLGIELAIITIMESKVGYENGKVSLDVND
jgi:hypothetical protein